MARLTSFTLENFRSYRNATLELGSLTLLVGANASGKSNAIEGLQMLSWLARGQRLEDVFRSVKDAEMSIRGQVSQLAREGQDSFAFSCEIKTEHWERLHVAIKAGHDGLKIIDESVSDSTETVPLYEVKKRPSGSGHDLSVAYNNFPPVGKRPEIPPNALSALRPWARTPQIVCTDQQAVFTQLLTPARFEAPHRKAQADIPRNCKIWMQSLQNILFLDPSPSKMRDYSFAVDKKLKGDGSNLSSALFALCGNNDSKAAILAFIKDLPEQNITDIDFLPGPRNEVMVRLEESFGDRKKWWDASLLSDGTLRVLAIAAALYSAPHLSTVVMEEIDNGIHPSRAQALLASVEAVAKKRKLAVLITTHNPAMLDALPATSVPNVVFCYRDPKEGDSRLVRLEDLPNYPELMARGPLGRLVTQGILDRMVKTAKTPEDKRKEALRYVAELKTATA